MDDDPESALIAELRSLAWPSPTEGSAFNVLHDGVTIAVSYSSGSSRSLHLEARYDQPGRASPSAVNEAPRGYRDAATQVLRATRPMRIALRPETAEDRAAKGEGLSVEHQSGDVTFDRRVYVDTPTTDSRVLGAVVNAEVRAAALALIDLGFHQLSIDDGDGKVSASMVEWVIPSEELPGRGGRAIAAFARLVSSLPPVTHAGGAHAPTPLLGWTVALGIVGGVGWSTNVGWAMGVVALFEAVSPPRSGPLGEVPTAPVVVSVLGGLAAGVMAWTLYGNAVKARARGRSDAHSIVSRAQWAAFGGVSVLVFTAMLIVAMATTQR